MLYYIKTTGNPYRLTDVQKNYFGLNTFFEANGAVSANSTLLVICKGRAEIDNELEIYAEKGSHLLGNIKSCFVFYYQKKDEFNDFKKNLRYFDENNISLFIASLDFSRRQLFEYSIIKGLESGRVINHNIYIPNKVSYINVKDFKLLKQLVTYHLKHENINAVALNNLKMGKVQEECKNISLDKVKKEFGIFDKEVNIFKYFLVNTGPLNIKSGFENNLNAAGKSEPSANKKNLELFEEKYRNRLERFLMFNCKISDEVTEKELNNLLSVITDNQYSLYFGKTKMEFYRKVARFLQDFKVMASRYKSDEINRPALTVSSDVDVFEYVSGHLARHYILDNLDSKDGSIGKNGFIGYKQSEYANAIISNIIEKLNNRYLNLKQSISDNDFSKNEYPIFSEKVTELFVELFENFSHWKYSNLDKRISVRNDYLENGSDIFSECLSFALAIKYINNHPTYFDTDMYRKFTDELITYIKSALTSHDYNIRILMNPNASQVKNISCDGGFEICLVPNVLEANKREYFKQNIDENAFAQFNYSAFVYPGFDEIVFDYL